MLLEQGLNYFLSFPEKELPNSLFCPLRSDILTKCSHTFSQQDLLLWLSNNKTCPTCRQSVVPNELKHNLAIREAIEEFEKTKNKFS